MQESTAVIRHAIMAWRDHQVMTAHGLLNTAAIAARQAFEMSLKDATFRDSAWDPRGFSYHRIDALLGYTLRGPLEKFFNEASADLAALSPQLTELAQVLARGDLVHFPEETSPSDEKPGEVEAAVGTARSAGWFSSIGGAIASTAGSLASAASETSNWIVQDKVGLRNRLRHAAMERIASAWMGDSGDPQPVLTQVLLAIDVAANEAKVTES